MFLIVIDRSLGGKVLQRDFCLFLIVINQSLGEKVIQREIGLFLIVINWWKSCTERDFVIVSNCYQSEISGSFVEIR